MFLFLLILAVIAAVYGLGVVASIIGYFFFFAAIAIVLTILIGILLALVGIIR